MYTMFSYHTRERISIVNPRRDVSKSGAAPHFLYLDSLRKEIYRRECEIILFFQIISVADWENDRSGRWRIWRMAMEGLGGVTLLCTSRPCIALLYTLLPYTAKYFIMEGHRNFVLNIK